MQMHVLNALSCPTREVHKQRQGLSCKDELQNRGGAIDLPLQTLVRRLQLQFWFKHSINSWPSLENHTNCTTQK